MIAEPPHLPKQNLTAQDESRLLFTEDSDRHPCATRTSL